MANAKFTAAKSVKSTASRRTENARRKVERYRAGQLRRERRKRRGIVGGACALVLGATALTAAFWPTHGSGGSAGFAPAAAPVLAPAAAQSGAPVDGIQSGSMEQLAFHIHAHLRIFVNGQEKAVPYGIGIVPPYQMTADAAGTPFVAGGRGIYWLHTHDTTGIIHMEAPAQVSFTLGEFFDMWGEPLTKGQVGPAQGTVTAFVNGKGVSGDPRGIELGAHDVIQLDVGTPVPFRDYTFPDGL